MIIIFFFFFLLFVLFFISFFVWAAWLQEVFRKAVTDAIQDNYAQLRADAQAEIAGLQAKR